jgi:hypothetical protein
MRFIAISVVVLAGAVMAAPGTLAEVMPDGGYSVVDEWGLAVVAVGQLLLVRELWQVRQEAVAEAARRRKERIVDTTVGIAELSRSSG